MKKKISRSLYWTPRVLSIAVVVFFALTSLDVFGNGYSFWQTVEALLIHNISTFVLLAVVLVSWKYELVGGIGFALLGLVYIASILVRALRSQFGWYMIIWFLQISGPLLLIAILYYLNWKRKKK